MKGWHYESWRHSLAAKGIRTSFRMKNYNFMAPSTFAMKKYDEFISARYVSMEDDELANEMVKAFGSELGALPKARALELIRRFRQDKQSQLSFAGKIPEDIMEIHMAQESAENELIQAYLEAIIRRKELEKEQEEIDQIKRSQFNLAAKSSFAPYPRYASNVGRFVPRAPTKEELFEKELEYVKSVLADPPNDLSEERKKELEESLKRMESMREEDVRGPGYVEKQRLREEYYESYWQKKKDERAEGKLLNRLGNLVLEGKQGIIDEEVVEGLNQLQMDVFFGNIDRKMKEVEAVPSKGPSGFWANPPKVIGYETRMQRIERALPRIKYGSEPVEKEEKPISVQAEPLPFFRNQDGSFKESHEIEDENDYDYFGKVTK
jgi:hypothetical protein